LLNMVPSEVVRIGLAAAGCTNAPLMDLVD
jgi:hypothetical protein